MTVATAAYSARAAEYCHLLGSMDSVHADDIAFVTTAFTPDHHRILDAGCGPGHWSRFLAERGHDVAGVDAVEEFVTYAKRHTTTARFTVADIAHIDEPDASFDGILAWYSLIHHAPESIDACLDEFQRLLRPGGRLVLGYFRHDTPEESGECTDVGANADAEVFAHAIAPAYRWAERALTARVRNHGYSVTAKDRRDSPDHRPHGALVAEWRDRPRYW